MTYDNHRNPPDAHQGQYPPYDRSHASSYDYDSHHRASNYDDSRPGVPVNGIPQPSQQPLKNAIGNAFEKSDAARVVDPDLIAQITAEVKKSVLDEIKNSVAASAGATHTQPVHVTPQYVPHSPASSSASVPPRDVYTPPSPKHTDFSNLPPVDHSARDLPADDTPTPRHPRNAPVDPPTERIPVRPAPVRMATDDCTPIEKMWQRLFDPEGQPLPRLSQFLRGVALHLVEDYEPKKSLVISPSKMLKFYEEVKLGDEIYPWETIFGKLSYSALSKVYRDMRCQHHLIQEHPAEQPYIPALTPEGFQDWMTAMIQAYPDIEYERLSKVVLDMPISNADDRKERFPKELPRRLFPGHENLHAQQRCAAALSSEGVGPLRKAPSFPPPPPKAQPPPASGLERERSPYGSQSEPRSFIIDEDPESAGVRIERERKPYAATPGGGKHYEDDTQKNATTDSSAQEQRRRRQSTAAQDPWAPPVEPRTAAPANTRRQRSPSFSNPGTQSDPNIRDTPSSYYASNVHNYNDDPRRYSKDSDGKRQDYHHRRSTAGTESSYDSMARSVYDDDDYRGRNGSSGYESRSHDTRRY